MRLECSICIGSRNPIGSGKVPRPSAGFVALAKGKQIKALPETLWLLVKTHGRSNKYEVFFLILEELFLKKRAFCRFSFR